MNTQNNTPASFRTRLLAFLLVLAIGFVMGWINGRGSATSAPTAETAVSQSSEETAVPEVQADPSGSDVEAPGTSTLDTITTGTDDAGTGTVAPERGPSDATLSVTEDGQYTSKDEVALYLHTYRHLPSNYISKTKARNKGWVATEGNLWDVCPGMSIGGSEYYNDEGQLPDARKRRWTECDINYHGGYRGAERIVFSNDGLIYYTPDHYRTFERMY